MAKDLSARIIRRFDSLGERRLVESLEKKLEDDNLRGCNRAGGPKTLQPDFVLMPRVRGVLVLELKDCKLDTNRSMDCGWAKILVDAS